MSSFLSVLPVAKIRGIPAIKIRILDYGRFSHPFFILAILFFFPVSPIDFHLTTFNLTNLQVIVKFQKTSYLMLHLPSSYFCYFFLWKLSHKDFYANPCIIYLNNHHYYMYIKYVLYYISCYFHSNIITNSFTEIFQSLNNCNQISAM